MKRKKIIGWVLAIGIAAFVLPQCEFMGLSESSDGSGGSGADFDASQYYTKEEVDTFIREIVHDGNWWDGGELTGSGWSNRGSGWAIPENAAFIMVELRLTGATTGDTLVNLSITDIDSNASQLSVYTTIPESSTTVTTHYVLPVNDGNFDGATTLYPYIGSPADFPSGFTVDVRCIGWI